MLDKAKYTIDSYQREYAWQERQVRELVEDLTLKFRGYYEPEHPRYQVENYGWVDEATWPGAIEKAVDTMERLFGALAPRVEAFRSRS